MNNTLDLGFIPINIQKVKLHKCDNCKHSTTHSFIAGKRYITCIKKDGYIVPENQKIKECNDYEK